MSIEVFPIMYTNSTEEKVLHLRVDDKCLMCGKSMIAMRTYWTTDAHTYNVVKRFTITPLVTHRGETVPFVACTKEGLVND